MSWHHRLLGRLRLRWRGGLRYCLAAPAEKLDAGAANTRRRVLFSAVQHSQQKGCL